MPEFGKGGGPVPFVNAFDSLPVDSLRYNTSQAGSPLPIAYGTCRISVNLLEYWGQAGGSGKGGKGGAVSGSKKNGSYSVNVAFAVCQGPVSFTGSTHGIDGNNQIWSNAGIAAGLGNVGLNGFSGADGQAPDANWAGNGTDPNQPVLGYSGTCYVTGDPMQLGSSPSLPNISFEITGFEAGTAGPNFPNDARPDLIVVDLLTNARYGAAFPAGNLDSSGSLADFGNYCQAAQIAMSPVLTGQQAASRYVEEICQLAVAAPFWSAAELKIVPYATAPVAANGAAWSPNLTAQYSFADRDFIPWGGDSDPVIVTRSDPAQAANWLSCEYYDSTNSYNPNIAYVFNQGAIDAYGVRTAPSVDAHSITNITSAQISAQLQLNRLQQIRNTFKFQLGWVAALLDPMDIVELTDSGAGLSGQAVRITGIEENDNGELTITAEELPEIAIGAPLYPTQAPASQSLPLFAEPGNANAPIIFEPSAALTGGDREVWLLSSGGASWGGANVWVSTDGTTYALAGTIYAGARQGVLTAALPVFGGTNPDTVDTLDVDLTESAGALVSGSAGDASAFVTLCYVGGELLSYETAALSAAYKYGLTTLYRGLYGTAATAHSSGATFGYVGLQADAPGLLKYSYAANLVGATISVKLQSFNTYGGAAQDLASLTPYSYVLTGNGAVSPLNVPFSFAGNPAATYPILNYTFGEGDNFPASLSGSIGTAGVAATAATIFDIAKNGGNFATMIFAAAAKTATFAGGAEGFVAGDVLTITPRTTDATLANLTGNLAGSS